MIDLTKLAKHRQIFGFFAQQLAYPDQHTFQHLDLEVELAPSIMELVEAYWDKMQRLSMDEIHELYVQTFDFQKHSTLYMTYAKLEDGKERGQMLLKLKTMYEMYGLGIADAELPDYLPLMCEFLYAADWSGHQRSEDGLKTLIAVLEDGTYGLVQALEKHSSPYYYVVKALRETFKQCREKEVGAL